jgi:hypothetical protein
MDHPSLRQTVKVIRYATLAWGCLAAAIIILAAISLQKDGEVMFAIYSLIALVFLFWLCLTPWETKAGNIYIPLTVFCYLNLQAIPFVIGFIASSFK